MRHKAYTAMLTGLLLAANIGRADAEPILFSNGALNDFSTGGSCDSGPSSCGGSRTWIYYDNFRLPTAATMTKFDYIDFFSMGSIDNYLRTNWSLWDADPFGGRDPLASGSVVASFEQLPLLGNPYRFAVTGLNVPLSPTTEYWLGITNVTSAGAVTTVGESLGSPGPFGPSLKGAKQGDTAGDEFATYEDRFFTVWGDTAPAPVPEPTSLLLLATGAAGMALKARKSRKRQN